MDDLDELEKKKQEAERKRKLEHNQEPSTPYIISRFIELLCIGAFVFGFLWNGTEVMNLTTPQFMMLYGGSGAVISEVVARIFKKKQSIK
jgi:hypothetical protein